MPRLGHKKSRNGCRQCKARHVKCDESKPCSSCARHGVLCSLVDPNAPPPTPIKREPGTSRKASKTPLNPDSEKPRQNSTPTSLPIDNLLNPSPAPTPGSSEASSPYSPNDTYPFLTKFSHKVSSYPSDYWLRDLELMHHWTVETYYFMASVEETRTFWRVEAPKQAVQFPFLLHEILAISALHKAYLDPDQRRAYYALGSYHQDLAIKEMRKTLPNLGPANVGAMFATGAVISLTALASTGLAACDTSPEERPAIDDLLDTFALQQGMYSILSANQVHVQGGAFAILLSSSVDPGRAEPASPILLAMTSQVPSLVNFIESRPLAPSTKTELQYALSSLKACLEFANSPSSTMRPLRFLFFWPNNLSQAFCAMLRRKEPAAMVVLAYYAVAFKAADGFYWFTRGWAERIIRAVVEVLAVDPSWQPILQWPWDFVIGTQHGRNYQGSQQSGTQHRPHEQDNGTLQVTTR